MRTRWFAPRGLRFWLPVILVCLPVIHTFVCSSTVAASEDLTLERIFGSPSLFSTLPRQVRWRGDGKAISYILSDPGEDTHAFTLVQREVPSGKRRVLCESDSITVPPDLIGDGTVHVSFNDYKWDHRGRTVVFHVGDDLFTLDARSGQMQRRTHSDGKEKDPTFSPDDRRIAFSRNHDLFVLDLESNEETRLTATGCDSILNGILDWVYMEELFTRGDVKAFWWSPDSRRLAFLEIRESPVPLFPLVDWIPVHAEYELQHYPKAGDPSPIVRVGMVDVGGGEVVWADTDTGDDSYIARVNWLGDSRGVAIEKINRAQDDLALLFADARSGTLEDVVRESDSTWVNVNYLKHYYEKKRQFLWGSERDGHSHLYLYNLDGSLIRQVTKGAWEVTRLGGVDEGKGKIYFTANEGDIRERHLYEINEKGEKLRRITSDEGTHNVTLSPDNKYYLDRYSSHLRPTRVAVYDIKGREQFVVGDQLGDELRRIDFATPEFFTIDANGETFYCMMTKPPDFDPAQKHPVIVYVYGGPGSQVVRRVWSRHLLWHSMMAEKGYVVFSLDNRGTGGRGRAWENMAMKRLGHYELIDQVAGVEYLKTQPYVDAENIGIWGWSYGGYVTLMALFKAGDVFKAGTAVAPVTDWRLYDSIYTERYMKRPIDNEEGYYDSAPVNFVDDFEGHLLLMHGDADDNVHMQNSIWAVRSLIDAGKDFELMVYPQRLHGISGTADRVHLYRKMTVFFDRYLKEASPPQMHP